MPPSLDPRAVNRTIVLCVRIIVCVIALAGVAHAQATASSRYLYLWTASADTTKRDFLAVLDADPTSARYGRLVTTVPVPGHNNGPHHSEHEMPADGRLFVNGFGSGSRSSST